MPRSARWGRYRRRLRRSRVASRRGSRRRRREAVASYDELVAAVKAEGGFDVADAIAGGWLNENHQKAVAEAQWLMRTLELGPTVAGVAAYALPDDVVD